MHEPQTAALTGLVAAVEAGALAGRMLEYRPPADRLERRRLEELERAGLVAERRLATLREPLRDTTAGT